LKNYLRIWIVLVTFLILSCSIAPSKLDQLTNSSPTDFSNNLYSDFESPGNQNGTGPHPYLPALTQAPKDIGLISFYIESTPHKKVNTYSFLSNDGSNKFANGLFRNGIDAIKQTFSKYGMNIISPEEFTRNDQHQFTYIHNNATYADKFASRLRSVTPMQAIDIPVSAIPTSFQYNPIHLLANDPGNNESLNRLRVDLNLDALMTIVNFVSFDGGDLKIDNVQLFIHGPNPIKPIRGQSYRGFEYVAGHLYAHGAIKFRPALSFADIQVSGFFSDKIALKEENYEGYDSLIRVLGEYTAKKLMADIDK